jgi:hypothetical protein
LRSQAYRGTTIPIHERSLVPIGNDQTARQAIAADGKISGSGHIYTFICRTGARPARNGGGTARCARVGARWRLEREIIDWYEECRPSLARKKRDSGEQQCTKKEFAKVYRNHNLIIA